MNQLTTKQKGNITELQCLTAFVQAGYKVSIPYGEDCKYDLIVDTGEKLLRIQCKTASAVDDEISAIKINTRSTIITTHGVKENRYSANEIDYFATFFNGQCYVIPIQLCLGTARQLRFKPTKNGQTKGILFATDYELEKVL